MSAPEWESSKENVQPVAQGRNVDVLNKALVAKTEDLNRQRAVHEAAIRDGQNGIGPYADDPLAPWVMYAKWVVENFPRGSDLIVSVVEGACRRFAKDSKYREDRRFVRLWIRYADLRDDKLDVFEYMQRHRIGETAALFYEAWATTLELARQYDKTEQTYSLGMRLGAQPSQRLALRQREYFARMAARARRAEKKAKDAAGKKKVVEKAKETRAGRSRATLADDILTQPDTNNTKNTTKDENSNPSASGVTAPVRPALGTISERQALTGRRPTVSAPSKPIIGERPSPPQSLAPASKSQKMETESFEIYADPSPRVMSPVAAHRKKVKEAEDFPFKPIGKRDEVQKENGGLLPSKWAGETLPQNDKARSRVNRGGLSERPCIEIYQEPENEESSNPSPRPENVSLDRQDRQALPNDLSHSPAPARKRSAAMSAISPTINTKIALQEVEDLFNSSLPMERARDEAIAESFSVQRAATRDEKNPDDSSFEIYKDQDDANASGNDSELVITEMTADKENALGARIPLSQVDGPSGNPDLEKRVLQPIPQYEGSVPQVLEDEGSGRRSQQVSQRDDRVRETQEQAPEQFIQIDEGSLKASDVDTIAADDLEDFLARWCFKEPSYRLLDGSDPEVVKDGLFDLHPRGQPLITFNVDMFLWSGHEGNSEVVFVEDLNNILQMRDSDDLDAGDADDRLALKVSENPNFASNSSWEFYIYKTLHDRYGTPLKSVPTAIAFYEGNPRSYLVLDSVSVCSLAETMSLSDEYLIPEPVAMFLTTDLLRTLEAIHTVGIIHGDVTLENILFRSDPEVELNEERYMASSSGSWSSKGVLLVDFNHAVDSKLAVPEGDVQVIARHVSKLGNKFLHSDYRIPDASLWGFNADCYSAAVCSAKMLKLDKLHAKDSNQSLKYEEIWDAYFQSMQNLSHTSRAAETADTMRRCRESMEGALFGEKRLRASLIKLSAQVEMKDAPDETMC